MSTETGLKAEAAASKRLQSDGFKILAQNWRNRFCEIDIIATKDKTVHFVEVKYRKSTVFGAGFDYITTDKINRLKKAAEVWLNEADKPNAQYQIDVMSVAGSESDWKIDYLPNAIED